MSYSVRHQVFISSTFTDLREERAEVIQAIWEMDAIPTGMEAFVASNESQWDVIRRVIDECDYYILVIGGRYGSVTEGGISYTEKEYRYAKSLGIPILAFVHGAPEELSVSKSELDEGLRAKLQAFRQGIMDQYPVRSWLSPTDLGGLVSRSLIREMKLNPRPGWIRNDGSSPIALLEQVNRLTEENRLLREAASAAGEKVDSDLASGNDLVELVGKRAVREGKSPHSIRQEWKVITNWDELWKDIGPAILSEGSEEDIQTVITRFNGLAKIPPGFTRSNLYDTQIDLETWNKVITQFRALGYMVPGTKKRALSDRNNYWQITPRGDRHLVGLLAARKPQNTA